MTVQGSDNFADAPLLPIPAVGAGVVDSLATPNGALTKEAGEPAPTNVERTAWWKLESAAGAWVTLSVLATGTKYIDVYTGTSLSDLTRHASNVAYGSTSTYVNSLGLAPGVTYYVRAGGLTSEAATSYTLRVTPLDIKLTPIANTLGGRTENITPNPSGDLFAGRLNRSSGSDLDDAIWIGSREGVELVDIGQVALTGLGGPYTYNQVRWLRWISDDTLMAYVRFGNTESTGDAQRLVVAHISGSTITSGAYPVIPGLAAGHIGQPSKDMHYANGVYTMLVVHFIPYSDPVSKFVSFKLSGATMTDVTVGANLPFTGSENWSIYPSQTKFLPNGDAFIALDTYRQVVTQQGQRYTKFRWSVNPALKLAWQTGMQTPYVNGRMWAIGEAADNTPGVSMASVDPYTGQWSAATLVAPETGGAPATQRESFPGHWFLVWRISSWNFRTYHIDLTTGVPVMLANAPLMNVSYTYVEPEDDLDYDVGGAVLGEEPNGMVHVYRNHAEHIYRWTYAWHPIYVEPVLTGGLRAVRRAFVG